MRNRTNRKARIVIAALLLFAVTAPSVAATSSEEQSPDVCGSTYGSEVEGATWSWLDQMGGNGLLDVWAHTSDTGWYAGAVLILTGELVQCITELA